MSKNVTPPLGVSGVDFKNVMVTQGHPAQYEGHIKSQGRGLNLPAQVCLVTDMGASQGDDLMPNDPIGSPEGVTMCQPSGNPPHGSWGRDQEDLCKGVPDQGVDPVGVNQGDNECHTQDLVLTIHGAATHPPLLNVGPKDVRCATLIGDRPGN